MERLSEQGVDLLYGRCTERFGTDEAFLPLIDALVTRSRNPRGVELLAAIRAHAATWLLQMPGSIAASERTAFQHEVFGATRERMLREFCDLLEALSADRPWVLVLEDLHWCDFATLDMLSRFARGTGKARVLVLGSYRPADSAIGGHPIRRLHQDLEIHGRCAELRLDRLSRAEVEPTSRCGSATTSWLPPWPAPCSSAPRDNRCSFRRCSNISVDQQAIVEIDGAWRLSSETAISSRWRAERSGEDDYLSDRAPYGRRTPPA